MIECPKCGYQRTPSDSELFGDDECPKCRISYEKYLAWEERCGDPALPDKNAALVPGLDTIGIRGAKDTNLADRLNVIRILCYGALAAMFLGLLYYRYVHFPKTLVPADHKWQFPHPEREMLPMPEPRIVREPVERVDVRPPETEYDRFRDREDDRKRNRAYMGPDTPKRSKPRQERSGGSQMYSR